MKLIMPNYYKKFNCIADKCKDSCCSAGWEIDIDKASLDKYNSVPGELGQKLKDNIALTSSPHFKLNDKNNCPFLNSNKLCELYLNLGPDSLCQICKEHPRYYEFFDGFKEGGIGLCCEEACRIILLETEKFDTFETTILETNSEDYNEELFEYLKNARKQIIDYLENDNIPIFSRLKDVLWYSQTLQQNIDFGMLDIEEIFPVKSYSESEIKPIIDFYLTLYPNKQDWFDTLKEYENLYEEKNIDQFLEANPEVSNYIKNIAIYFIWRYFLKGIFDEDILSKVKLMISSVLMIRYLFYCKWLDNNYISLEDCIEIAKKYSEEIEYSEENIYKLAQASYDLDIFDTENLLNIL